MSLYQASISESLATPLADQEKEFTYLVNSRVWI